MASIDTSVQDVSAGAGAGRVVVDVRGRAAATVRDTAETPGGTGLGGVGLEGDDGVLLNEVDVGVVAEGVEGLLVQAAGEAAEAVLEDVVDVVLGQDAHGVLQGGECGGVLELDDVLVSDESAGLAAGGEERSGLGTLGRCGQHHGQEAEEDRQTHDEELMDGLLGC